MHGMQKAFTSLIFPPSPDVIFECHHAVNSVKIVRADNAVFHVVRQFLKKFDRLMKLRKEIPVKGVN